MNTINYISNIKYKDIIFKLIKKEKYRQENNINLIASENYASLNILKAQGSILTNKYAEGTINNRFYSGCKYIDQIEYIAINRAKKLFNANYANVQPHSGTQANLAVLNAILKPGDTILGMELNHGGHFTHGSHINITGQIYKTYLYGLNNKGKINYNQIYDLAHKYHPKIIIAGFSAYSLKCHWKKFKKIANLNKCLLMIDMAHIAGLVAAKLYPNPLDYADIVTTTTHKTLSGPRGGLILAKGNNYQLYKKIDKSVFPGTQGGPLMHIIAAKAICFKEALTKTFIYYQKEILKNTKIIANYLLKKNITLISNGTQTHLFLINLSPLNLTGIEVQNTLEKTHILVNKNCIPNDKLPPTITSGIRIGTAAITKRGINGIITYKIAKYLFIILKNFHNKKILLLIKKKIKKICKKYPIY